MECPDDRKRMQVRAPEKPILPISSSLPSYTTLNRRRRITCQTCQLPIGYLTLDLCEIESWRTSTTREAKLKNDDRLIGAICIPNPVNVGIRRNIQNKDTGFTDHHQHLFTTSIIRCMSGKHCEAEEAICDGCGSCLGSRITEYEMVTSDSSARDDDGDCGVITNREEKKRWFAFSEDQVEVEPLMGLLNLDKLSISYNAGEKYFFETRSIEESPKIANDSKKWMHGLYRKRAQEEVQSRVIINNYWPLLHQDLVSVNDLPLGTLGREIGVEWAVSNASQAFSDKPAQKILVDNMFEQKPC